MGSAAARAASSALRASGTVPLAEAGALGLDVDAELRRSTEVGASSILVDAGAGARSVEGATTYPLPLEEGVTRITRDPEVSRAVELARLP